MKTAKELKEERKALKASIKELRTAHGEAKTEEIKTEKREAIDAKIEELVELSAAIVTREKLDLIDLEEDAKEAKAIGSHEKVDKREGEELDKIAETYSFGKAIRAAYGIDKLDGEEAEMAQEGKKEMRAIGQPAAGIVIPHAMLYRSRVEKRAVITENSTTGIEVMPFIQAVYANTILGDLGVMKTTTNSDQRIPIIGATTTKWEGETDDAADGGNALSKQDLSPNRAASYLDFSKQASLQWNPSLENALRDSMSMSLAAKVELGVFTDESAEGAPADIGAGKTAVTAATVTAMVLAAMEEVLGNNHMRGRLGFAITHQLFSEVWTAVLATGVSPLVANNLIMSMPFKFSSQIADIAAGQEAIYFGDWSKLQMAQFGGVEILLDNLTQAIGGKDRLVLNSYWDWVLTQDAAISVAGFTG